MRRIVLCAAETFAMIAAACFLLGASLFAAEGKAPAGRQGAVPGTGAVTPPPTKENVAYGLHPRNMLDYWQAKADKPTPVVVFMHGGSFFLGDKSKVRDRSIIAAYLERGVSCASINYRFRKDAPLQDILRDAGRAIQFLRYNAQAWNIDKRRIAMFGESAGAGTSLWLAAHPDLANHHSDDPVLRESSRLAAAGCVDGQATYDIPQWDRLVGTFKPEWLLNPNEIVQLYHFQSEADFKTPQGRKILEDCDMLHWLSRDTAPIFMFSDVYDVEPKIRQDYVHHPRHMAVVKRQCDAVGAQCTVVKREDLGNPAEHNKLLLAFLLAFGLVSRITAADEAMFPFLVSYDAPQTVANVSGWHPGPAGAHGFLRANAGHFADDRGPMRLWGTNLCEGGCFPEKHKAERVAARLAALGINCVRLHHMDRSAIWGNSPNKLTIDPAKLDQLDYLIYQLKQHGIYVDVNLHVSRSFGEADGFSAQQQRPIFDKGLDNFEPRMIELQKKFARDLLTHVNPYTKTAYTHEPAVAMVEINNENSLYTAYKQSWLDPLPDPYAATYRKLWNDWLRRKYGDTDRLKKAWNTALAAEQRLEDGSVAVVSRRATGVAEAERAELRRSLDAYGLVTDKFGVGRLTALEHAIALDLSKGGSPSVPRSQAATTPPAKVFVSDTGQIRWDVSRPGKVISRSTAREQNSSRASSMAATGVVENVGMKLEQLEGGRVTVHDQWGAGPVVCEGITADVSLPVAAKQIEFFSLDEAGKRKAKIEAAPDGDKTILPLRPAAKTVWYEIVVR